MSGPKTMTKPAIRRRGRHLPAVLSIVVGLVAAAGGAASEAPVQCTVTYESPGGIYVDAGSDEGLTRGCAGLLFRDGTAIAGVEVVEVARSTALLRVLTGDGATVPRIGDRVELRVEGRPPAGEDAEGEAGRSPTLKSPGGEEPFIPLLAPPEHRALATTEATDLFHGQAWVRQLLQSESEHDSNYSITRFGSSGSYERMGGSPWTLGWSGDLSYRAGPALEGTRDYEDVVLHVYRLALFRRFDDQSHVTLGRFLPGALPGVGYLDGVEGEKVLCRPLRIGILAGLKPTRERLDLSAREPTLCLYATVEAGSPHGTYFSGTAGVLGSLYEGKPDRLAFLLDQTLRITSRFALSSTSEVDLDVGGAEFRSGASLTRLDLTSSYVVGPLLQLRGGVDHYQRPDTRAERDAMPLVTEALFDDGYWRYFAGASHDLPWKFRLSEEVSWIDSDSSGSTFHWTISLTRTDLPCLPGSSATITAYSLDGPDANGYGGRIQASIPLFEGRLSILPAASARSLDVARDSEDFQLADVSLGIRWRISSAWSVSAGFTRAFGTDIGAYVLDLGLTFRW